MTKLTIEFMHEIVDHIGKLCVQHEAEVQQLRQRIRDLERDYGLYQESDINSGKRYLFNNKIEDTAIDCSECNQVVVAEYHLGTKEIVVFEHTPYVAREQQKVRHPHPAGPIMRKRVEGRIAVEIRLLHSFSEDDFNAFTKKRGIN
jgi:hypothetical protein